MLETEYLSPIDWERLHKTSKFLSLFDRATLKTQEDQATIDNMLFVMDIIIKHFEKALNGWDIFDKYYSKLDKSSLYATALILHPVRRI
ncbi:hypothetical protein BDV29DRAFT_186897, partial [Aspergillus leporis]